jgi:hypothetical protein
VRGLVVGLLPLLLLGCGDTGSRDEYFRESHGDGVVREEDPSEGLSDDPADWPVAEPQPEDFLRPSPPPAPSPLAAASVSGRTVLWDGLLFMDYGQAYVHDGQPFLGDLDAMFAGQANGLLGAAAPRNLALITATHTGEVPVRIELLPAAPAVLADHDVVEASFSPRGQVTLMAWQGNGWDLTLPPGDYRARWSGKDLDAGREAAGRDSYLLQLWPAAPAPDRVVAVVSETAARWHAAWG